jgi:hypothetical protein
LSLNSENFHAFKCSIGGKFDIAKLGLGVLAEAFPPNIGCCEAPNIPLGASTFFTYNSEWNDSIGRQLSPLYFSVKILHLFGRWFKAISK